MENIGEYYGEQAIIAISCIEKIINEKHNRASSEEKLKEIQSKIDNFYINVQSFAKEKGIVSKISYNE